MREKWAAEVDARARAFWTEDRTRGLLGNKQLILPPVEHGPLLRCMGLLKADASMSPESVRKYMQISHMLTLLEPLLEDLAKQHEVVRVLDLACGNSYLTLTLSTSLKHRIRHPARVLGVDRNARLIEACRERAWRLHLDDILKFEASMIDRFAVAEVWQRAFGSPPASPPAHLLVALHACDTATDDAIALGVSMGVPAMAVAPCCQAELAKAWSELEPPDRWALAPIARWPHMRRDLAATMTDALRTLLLRGCGYHASPIEFVPSPHTPKNTMIRALKTSDGAPALFREYLALEAAAGGIRLTLANSLPEPHATHLRQARSEAPDQVR